VRTSRAPICKEQTLLARLRRSRSRTPRAFASRYALVLSVTSTRTSTRCAWSDWLVDGRCLHSTRPTSPTRTCMACEACASQVSRSGPTWAVRRQQRARRQSIRAIRIMRSCCTTTSVPSTFIESSKWHRSPLCCIVCGGRHRAYQADQATYLSRGLSLYLSRVRARAFPPSHHDTPLSSCHLPELLRP